MTELIYEAGGVARECPECGKDGIISALEAMRVYGKLMMYIDGYEQPHTEIDGLRYLCDKCKATWVES